MYQMYYCLSMYILLIKITKNGNLHERKKCLKVTENVSFLERKFKHTLNTNVAYIAPETLKNETFCLTFWDTNKNNED